MERKRLLKDELGGGRYIASGYGNMGRNVSRETRCPDQPALRKCLRYSEHHIFGQNCQGNLFSCVEMHCQALSHNLQEEQKTNED